jgi:hypothetical protein
VTNFHGEELGGIEYDFPGWEDSVFVFKINRKVDQLRYGELRDITNKLKELNENQ